MMTETIAGHMENKNFFTKDHLEFIVKAGADVMDAALAKFPKFGCTVQVLRSLMLKILVSPGRWFYYAKSVPTKRSITSLTKDQCASHTMFCLIFAAKLLQMLKLGKVLMTLAFAGGGNYNWFFLKRPAAADNKEALAFVGVTDDSEPTAAAYDASIAADTEVPTRAPPGAIDWAQEVWNDDSAQSILRKLGFQPFAAPLAPALAVDAGAGEDFLGDSDATVVDEPAPVAGVVGDAANGGSQATVVDEPAPVAGVVGDDDNGGFGV
jgi:hypothetical protein